MWILFLILKKLIGIFLILELERNGICDRSAICVLDILYHRCWLFGLSSFERDPWSSWICCTFMWCRCWTLGWNWRSSKLKSTTVGKKTVVVCSDTLFPVDAQRHFHSYFLQRPFPQPKIRLRTTPIDQFNECTNFKRFATWNIIPSTLD